MAVHICRGRLVNWCERLVASLSFDGFDVDHVGEMMVYLNDQLVASLPETDMPENEEQWRSYSFDVTELLQARNELIFTLGDPVRGYSIKNVTLKEDDTVLRDVKTYSIRAETPSVVYTVEKAAPQPWIPLIILAGILLLLGG